MSISDQFTVCPWLSSMGEIDYDTDSTIVPLNNPRPRNGTIVKFDNEFKADDGEARNDTNVSEIGDNEIEERRRLHSATSSVSSSVSTPHNYEHEWGVRRIIGKKVAGGQIHY